MSLRRLTVAMVVPAYVLAACLPGSGGDPPATPNPSPVTAAPTVEEDEGLSVGLVLAPPDSAAATIGEEVRDAAAALARGDGGEVGAVRVLAPADEDFRADQLVHLIEAGADIVCAVGEDARRALALLAARHPRTAFCLLGGDPEPAQGLLVVSWHEEGVAFLAGAAAAMSGDEGAGVAVVTRGPADDGMIAAFAAGVASVDEDRPVEVLALRTTGDPVEVRAALEEALVDRHEDGDEDGDEADDVAPLDVLVPLGAPDLIRAVAEVASARGSGVVGLGTDLAHVLDEAELDVVIVSVVRRARPGLDRVVRAVTDEDVAAVGVARLGVDEAVTIRPGGAGGAVDVAERVVTLVDRVAAGETGP